MCLSFSYQLGFKLTFLFITIPRGITKPLSTINSFKFSIKTSPTFTFISELIFAIHIEIRYHYPTLVRKVLKRKYSYLENV